MNTKLIKIDKNNIDKDILKKAGELIADGKLVAFPTETVYGLGADALNDTAVKNIFKAKGRPQDNPLILHVDSLEMVEKLVKEIPDNAKKLMDRFWPGPLTIIFERSPLVPDSITGGLETVAIRMPDDEIARKLIEYSKTPIAAPSANTSGRPSPTLASHVMEDLDGLVDMVIDGGSTGIGLESTVVDITEGDPVILRPGGITLEDLRAVFKDASEDRAINTLSKDVIPKSPGQKYRHYAPKVDMFIYEGSIDFMVDNINKDLNKYLEKGLKVGIIATEETLNRYKHDVVISLGKRKSLEEIGHNLFNILRGFDSMDVDVILSETFDRRGFGKAIMNRLEKSSGGNIIKER